MANYEYANNPQTTLSGSITAGATSLSVASGTTFPTRGKFTIIIDSEIILVTGVSGTTWTIERGVEGTTAAAHNNNATVTGILTRASFLDAHHYDVRSFGAVGDGSTDDTEAFADAISAASAGDTIYVPRPASYYRITSRLTIDKSLTIRGDGLPEIRQITTSTGLFLVTADNVTIEGLNMVGPGHTADGGLVDTAVTATGASASDPIAHFVVRNNVISGWGFHGVEMEDVTDFVVSHNRIFDLWYNGVHGSSCLRGIVSNNHIKNLVANSGTNDEPSGIAFGRDETDSYSTDPRSADIVIDGNTVTDVTWQGIDTHGGERILISNNVLRNCNRAISVTDTDDSTNSPKGAPLDVDVIGNVITSGVADGSASLGINFSGALDGDTVIERARGSIVGNVIRGHGEDGSGTNLSAGIRVHTSIGLVISGNFISEPSPQGINIERDNEGFVCTGNTIVDVWSDLGASIVAAIATRSTNNRGFIGGNTLADGTRTSAAINTMGIRLNADAAGNTLVSLGQNNMEGATTPLSDASADGRMYLRTTKLGFYSAAPITKPTVSGSRGGNAALADLLTELENLGLITDSSSA